MKPSLGKQWNSTPRSRPCPITRQMNITVIQLKHETQDKLVTSPAGNTSTAPDSDKAYAPFECHQKQTSKPWPANPAAGSMLARAAEIQREQISAGLSQKEELPSIPTFAYGDLSTTPSTSAGVVSRGTTLGISRRQISRKIRAERHKAAHSRSGEQIPRIGKTHKSAMKARKTALQASPFRSIRTGVARRLQASCDMPIPVERNVDKLRLPAASAGTSILSASPIAA